MWCDWWRVEEGLENPSDATRFATSHGLLPANGFNSSS